MESIANKLRRFADGDLREIRRDGVGVDNNDLTVWSDLMDDAADEIDRLQNEIACLRQYGNNDCTHMADEALANGWKHTD